MLELSINIFFGNYLGYMAIKESIYESTFKGRGEIIVSCLNRKK